MSKDTSGPAFPCPGNTWKQGMTLRDYFAAKAMQSILGGVNWNSPGGTVNIIAEGAYQMADAMLAEHAK